MKLPIFVFVGNPINKNRAVVVWKEYHNVFILVLGNDPFLASVPILYPLKDAGNQKPCSVFRGYKMRTMPRNCLIKAVIPRSGLAWKISFLACCFRRPGGAGVNAWSKGGLKLVGNSFQGRRC